ncbi:golgin subfamily A member 6-like protein 7 [Selaginella moellendorffii]|uniref:golgin subfamily A member 6-like protein 7 n=1 Tax=Selaginella moellendorffii TaxID=88036 RepID=UPI000D1C7131|nr:golgin subfamily A member 6-like protein 7 [Selaginella moellendorffii]|eukprot:XP_024521435.1 golgin subfamily A member 6-like protein 7 [Selaginella moellendorffii]
MCLRPPEEEIHWRALKSSCFLPVGDQASGGDGGRHWSEQWPPRSPAGSARSWSGVFLRKQQKNEKEMEDPNKDSSGGDDQVTVTIHFAEPDLVYTIHYSGGVLAQAAFDESVEKGISQFLEATGLSKEDFVSHPEGMWFWSQEETARQKGVAMARAVMLNPQQEQLGRLQSEKNQLKYQLLAAQEELKGKAESEKQQVMIREAEQQQMKIREAAQKEARKQEEEAAKVAKKRHDQLVSHIDSLQRQLREKREELDTHKKLLREQRDLLDKQSELVQQEVDKQLLLQQAEHEAEKLLLQEKVMEKLELYNAERRYRDNDTKQKKSLQKDLERKKVEKVTDEMTIVGLEKQIGELSSRVVSLDQENGKLRSRVATLEQENGKLSSRVASLEQENGKLSSRVASLELQNSTLVQKNEEMSTLFLKEMKELRDMMSTQEKEHKITVGALCKRIDELETGRRVPG